MKIGSKLRPVSCVFIHKFIYAYISILTLRIYNQRLLKRKTWPPPSPPLTPCEVEGVRIVVTSIWNIAKKKKKKKMVSNWKTLASWFISGVEVWFKICRAKIDGSLLFALYEKLTALSWVCRVSNVNTTISHKARCVSQGWGDRGNIKTVSRQAFYENLKNAWDSLQTILKWSLKVLTFAYRVFGYRNRVAYF